MFTQRGLKNEIANFQKYSRDILTPLAHDAWRPIILALLEEAYSNRKLEVLPCVVCELSGGCIVQPFTDECEEYRQRN